MDTVTQRKWDAASRNFDLFSYGDDQRLGPHKQSLFAKIRGKTLMVAVGTGNLVWRDAPRDRHGRLPPQADALHGTREWWGWGAEAPRLALQARHGFDTAWQRAKAPADAWHAAPLRFGLLAQTTSQRVNLGKSSPARTIPVLRMFALWPPRDA